MRKSIHPDLNSSSKKVHRRIDALFVFFWIVLYAGCVSKPEPIELPSPVVEVSSYTATPTITPTATFTLTPTITPLRTIAPTLTATATPDPFVDFYIENLQARKYGGGVLEDAGELNSSAGFTRRLFKYRSEGLELFGFINIPDGDGLYPVIIMLHGFVEPNGYSTLDYSTRYADALAEKGFLVIHPNLRGYDPSEDGENALGIGDTIDTLNIISLVRQQSGSAGLLENADGNRIGLWGHSMGGGVVMRILVIDQGIDAALLYAPIHANEEFNLAHFEKDGRGREKIAAPAVALQKISPLFYLEQIGAPISIHHGTVDAVVPISWSRFLCDFLKEADIEVDCTFYLGQPHTFRNSGDALFIQNTIDFFSAYLK